MYVICYANPPMYKGVDHYLKNFPKTLVTNVENAMIFGKQKNAKEALKKCGAVKGLCLPKVIKRVIAPPNDYFTKRELPLPKGRGFIY